MTMTWQQPKKELHIRKYFKKMGLPQTLTDVGIDKEYFDIMAQKRPMDARDLLYH